MQEWASENSTEDGLRWSVGQSFSQGEFDLDDRCSVV